MEKSCRELMKQWLRRNRMTVSLILVFTFTASGLSAQKMTADSTRFPIGGQIYLTLSLEVNAGDRVTWPETGDTLTSRVEIISKTPVDTSKTENGKLLLSQKLLITSFDTGFITVPPVSFQLATNGGSTQQLLSDPLLLEITKPTVDLTKDIRDIKPVMTAPYTLRDFLPWILLLLAAGLIGTLLWFYIRNRKRNKPFIKLPSRPARPPHELALEALDNLKKEQLWQKGQVKEYYTRLTDILREYFEKRFGVNAAEMTSDEILGVMKDFLEEVSTLNDLRKVLTLADLAKFAKGQPIGAENELSFTYARSIVMTTSAAPVMTQESSIVSETSTENASISKTNKD